jgi:hypothetical protein
MGVLVGVGVFVIVGVGVTVGVSVKGSGVKVEVAARNAEVSIADQVCAAAVSGQPGTLDTAPEPMPHAMDINNARRIRTIRCLRCFSIIASTQCLR